MSRTRPGNRRNEPAISWLVRPGRRVYAVAARESLFDVTTLTAADMVQVSEAGMVRMLTEALKRGGVVRIDNDPPVEVKS